MAHEVVEAASRQSAKSSAMRVSSATEEDDDEEDDGDTEGGGRSTTETIATTARKKRTTRKGKKKEKDEKPKTIEDMIAGDGVEIIFDHAKQLFIYSDRSEDYLLMSLVLNEEATLVIHKSVCRVNGFEFQMLTKDRRRPGEGSPVIHYVYACHSLCIHLSLTM